MMNQRGSIEAFLIGGLLFFIICLFVMIPISCDQSIKRKQVIMAQTGVELTYWDIFWTNPELRYNRGKIVVEEE